MAYGGEITARDPRTGRAFAGLLEYTHYEGFSRGYERRGITPPDTLEFVDNGPALEAHISHDRWVVDCPDCGGADVVFMAEPLMWCHECGNRKVGGKWRRVSLPSNAKQIEAILSLRPRVDQRNWRAEEMIEDLIAQNVEAGDRVP